MVGKRSGKAQLREEGLEKTDNNLELSAWPVVNMINQKNYYTDYLKRDDQFLAYRYQNEEARNRMVREARDKDRALAQGGADGDAMDVGGGDADEVNGDAENDETKAPEALGSKVIVIHPGSQNLRVGLGSDALPRTVPMVIAKKWHENEAEEENGEPRPKRLKIDGEIPAEPEKWFGEEFASEYSSMSSELKVRMRNNKRRVLPNSKELVVNYNRRTPPDTIPAHNDLQHVEWTEIPPNPREAPEYFTGQAALRIPEESNPRYKLFWPIRNGWLNEKDYDSKNLLYHDIAVILEEAINLQLGLSKRKEWSQYSCVFIIPDLYERNFVTAILEILIHDIGLGRVCFQQESLAATFGAGYSISCIVDIGAEKTSVCCVDEGLCIEDSRLNVKFGGMDVTDTFIKMMLYDHFPYEEINLKNRYDFLLAEELKQRFCTMNEQEITVQLWDFYLRASGQDTRKYYFKTYDEVMLAPMGYFRPSIFDHSQKLAARRKLIDRAYDLYDGAPNDPISPAQSTVIQYAAGRSGTENGIAKEATPAPAITSSAPGRQQPYSLLSRLHEQENTPRSSIAGSPAPEGTPQPHQRESSAAVGADDPADGAAPGRIFHDPTLEKVRAAEERDRTLPVMPLDMAIVASVTQGGRGDERKMRDFFGGIMLIGGGSKIGGLSAFLEERLKSLRPAAAKDILIGTPPRDLDPQVLVWKGGSVFGKLSASGNDSWISQREYEVLGNRLLVHKCMFPW